MWNTCKLAGVSSYTDAMPVTPHTINRIFRNRKQQRPVVQHNKLEI